MMGEPIASRVALVAGGTGLVGRSLLGVLAGDARYRLVISLARRDTPIPGVMVQRVDFDRLDEVAVPAIDDAFCCLGTTRRTAGSAAAFRRVDFDYVVAFARLAKRGGAQRFLLVSSVGAAASSPFLYPRTKGESEAAIAAMGFASVVILRPSFLLGARAEARPGEAATSRAFELLRPVLIGPLRKYAPVEASTVARVLVASAAAPDAGVTVLESNSIR